MSSAATRRTAATLDRVSLALAIAFGGWILLGANAGPGRRALLGLLAATVVAIWASVWLTRLSSWAVPAVVALSPFVAAVATGRGMPPQGPLSYENASASLMFVGAAGALMVAARAKRPVLRLAAGAVYALYALVPLAIGSVAAGLMALVLPVGLFARRRPSVVRALVMAGVVGVVLALAVTITLAVTYDPEARTAPLDRLVDATLSERRVQLASEALAMVQDRPFTGVGPGRFAQVSPTARLDPDASWAHNEFLQVAGETGLVGLALGLALLTWALIRPWWGPRDAGAGIAVIAVAGVAVHATIDYILHFPAVPLVAAALLGAGLVVDARPEARDPDVGQRQGSDLALVLPSVAVLVLLVVPWGPLNPPQYAPNGAGFGPDGALRFSAPGVVRSVAPPRQVYQRIANSNAFTLDVWARAATPDQHGPARIVSTSTDPYHRNLTLGQQDADLVARIRTNRADLNGTEGEMRFADVFGDGRQHHLAVTVDDADVYVYVDGDIKIHQSRPNATLSSWDRDYPLLLGNEEGGGRPWLGTVRAVTFHDRALSTDEVRRRAAGPVAEAADHDLLVRYDLSNRDLSDRAPPDLAPRLVMPPLVRVSPQGFWASLTDVGQHQPLLGPSIGWAAVWSGRALRVAGVLAMFLLFFGWAVLTRRAAGHGRSAMRTTLIVIATGIALAFGVEALQFLQARSASVVDVLVAAGGAAVGAGYAARRWVVPTGVTSTDRVTSPSRAGQSSSGPATPELIPERPGDGH